MLVPTDTRVAPSDRLVHLEAIIEKGLRPFVEIGAALKEINDNRLWSPEYDSFDAYCHGRWNFHRRTGYSLITAASVFRMVSSEVQAPAQISYSHAAEMVTLKPSEQVAMAQEIVRDHLSTRDVRRIIDERFPKGIDKPAKVPYAPPRGRASVTTLDTAPLEGADLMLCSTPGDPPTLTEIGRFLRPGSSFLIPFSAGGLISTDPMIRFLGILGIGIPTPYADGMVNVYQDFYTWWSKGLFVGKMCSNRLSGLAEVVRAITFEGDTIYEVAPVSRSVLDEAITHDRNYVAINPSTTVAAAVEVYRQAG